MPGNPPEPEKKLLYGCGRWFGLTLVGCYPWSPIYNICMHTPTQPDRATDLQLAGTRSLLQDSKNPYYQARGDKGRTPDLHGLPVSTRSGRTGSSGGKILENSGWRLLVSDVFLQREKLKNSWVPLKKG